MEIRQPGPLTFEEVRHRGEVYRQTGELDSDIVASLGQIPNPEQLLAQDGEFHTYFGIVGDEITALQKFGQERINVLRPFIDLVVGHYREFYSLGASAQINGNIDCSVETIGDDDGTDLVHKPHTDGLLDKPESAITYITVLNGTPTKIWRGKFDHSVKFNLNFKEDNYYAEEYQRQIKEGDIPLIELQEGQIVCINSHTVHASSGIDMAKSPENIGKHRLFISAELRNGSQ